MMNAHAPSRQNTVSTKELQIGTCFTFQAAPLREEHNLLSVWERGARKCFDQGRSQMRSLLATARTRVTLAVLAEASRHVSSESPSTLVQTAFFTCIWEVTSSDLGEDSTSLTYVSRSLFRQILGHCIKLARDPSRLHPLIFIQ